MSKSVQKKDQSKGRAEELDDLQKQIHMLKVHRPLLS